MVPAKRTSPKNTLLLKSRASSNVTFKNRRCVCYNGTTVMRTLPVTFCVVICGLSLSMLGAALGDTGLLFDSKTRCFHTKCVREARKVTSAEWAGRGLTGYLRVCWYDTWNLFSFLSEKVLRLHARAHGGDRLPGKCASLAGCCGGRREFTAHRGLLDFMSAYSASSSSSSSSSCARVSSVRRAGPQPRSCEFSVACRTSTAIVWVQCGVPDLNRDRVRSVWRAGPQPRSCEFSVACRASTAIVCVQCGVPGLNRDRVSSVWSAGPQPRSCEFSVACRTSTAIMWVQCGAPDLNREMCQKEECQKDCQKICQEDCQKICQKECQKICQKECQKICQKECQKICQKECQKICQKECQKICQKECQKIRQKECQKICQTEFQKTCQKECQKECQKICQKIASSQSAKLRVTECISGDELYVYPHLTRSGWHKI